MYVYRRRDGSTFELEQRITVDALVTCPTTGQAVDRVMQQFSPRYTGPGVPSQGPGGGWGGRSVRFDLTGRRWRYARMARVAPSERFRRELGDVLAGAAAPDPLSGSASPLTRG